MNEANTLTLKGWLLGARPAPNENKLHISGFLLAIANLILLFFGWISPASGIGIADHYPGEAISMLMPGIFYFVPMCGPLLVFVLLFLRRYLKSRAAYYVCNAVIWGCTIAAVLVVCWNFYTVGYIYEHFQPICTH